MEWFQGVCVRHEHWPVDRDGLGPDRYRELGGVQAKLEFGDQYEICFGRVDERDGSVLPVAIPGGLPLPWQLQ